MSTLSRAVAAIALFAAAQGAVAQALARTVIANPASVHCRDQGAQFDCDGGKSIEAAYFNTAPSHVELTLSDGRRLVLPQAVSGSGARYVGTDERIVFWNKGDTAFIDEQGRQTYTDCRTRR